MAMQDGDNFASMRHWRLSAAAGYRHSMECLIQCFEDGLLLHADLAEALRAFFLARGEMRSDNRDTYIAHLKKIGEYRKEWDY